VLTARQGIWEALMEPVHHRRAAFDRDVRLLAPLISEARTLGIQSKEELTNWLNADDRATAIRAHFSCTSLVRLINRMADLDLGPKLRSFSVAASQRPYRFSSRDAQRLKLQKAFERVESDCHACVHASKGTPL
jgi:hypothetical protein